jgi:branched-chain amino acid transport system substrate-binding protein
MYPRSKTLSIIVLACILTGLLSNCTVFTSSGGAVTIAVVENAPLLPNGEVNPQSVYAGVKMAVDQINDQGGVGGQRVIVKVYVDGGNQAVAESRANEIVKSNAVAVIGHSSIETSNAAAKIYDEKHIAVIGVVPGDTRLANDYNYYFNLSFTANQEAAYLANYVVKVLDADKDAADKTRNRVTIIYTDDEYSATLRSQFTNTLTGLGGKVINAWKVGRDDASIEDMAGRLATLNSETENPGTLFITADQATAAKLLIKMRRKGLNYPMIGASNLTGAIFESLIRNENEEKAQPGYFTNGLIAARSLIFDSANEQASLFFDEYQAKLGASNEPNDLAANGYDAALTLFAAIQKSQPGDGGIESDRAALYNALVEMDNPNLAIQGIAGRIYFDPAHKTVRGPRFGIYQHGQLISAATQFEPVTDAGRMKDGRVVTVNGENVFMVSVVYAGIDVLNISEIDIKTSSYKMDFYLWFRYPTEIGDLQLKPEEFVFVNAQSLEDGYNEPVSLIDDPDTGLTTATYRVAGIFKNQFSFYEYPFDVQSLLIQFRNVKATSSSIKYAVDRIGMQYPNDAALQAHFKENGAFSDLYGWSDRGAHSEQVTFSTTSTLGDPQNFEGSASTDFSLIKLTVEIKRDSLQYIIKSLLPLLITLVLAYITFFLPIGHSERLTVGSTALLTTAFFHISLAGALPEIGYTVAMEFLFYASYAVSALIVLLETLSIRLEKQGEKRTKGAPTKKEIHRRRENLNWIGRVVYPTILFAAILAGGLVYAEVWHLGPESETALKSPVRPFVARVDQGSSEAEQTPEVAQGDGEEAVVLELATWRPENAADFQVILDAFHEYALTRLNRDITVRYAPVMSINYDTILSKQLSDGAGPALFYVRPFSVDGSIVRFLEPLDDLGVEERYDPVKSLPWQGRDGAFYALPFAGVVQGVYYNKDLFAQYKVELPTAWAELLMVARRIQQESNGTVIPIANTLNDTEDSEMFQSILANFVGGVEGRADFTSTSGKNLCFTNARIVNAFDALQDLKPYLYLPENTADRKSDKSKKLFFNGEAAMLFGGSWDVKLLSDKELDFEWSVFAAPAPAGKSTVIFHPDSGIGINSNSPHVEEARLFIEWLMSDQAVVLIVENLPGFYPLRQDVTGGNEDIHAQEFLQLASVNPTDARWAETGISDHVPSAQWLIRRVLFEIAYNDMSPREAARILQSGLGEWYEPAQTCR